MLILFGSKFKVILIKLRIGKNIPRKINIDGVKIKYLYPKLDQYELLDLLIELPEDQFNNLKETDLQYPWVLRNAKKFRKDN